MISITETTKPEVEKILRGLNWISQFWAEKMKAIAISGTISIKEFNELKDTGIKFHESFVMPMAAAYEKKLGEFKEEPLKEAQATPVTPPVVETPQVSPGASEPRGSLSSTKSGNGTEVKPGDPVDAPRRRGRPPTKNLTGKDTSGNITLTPSSKPEVPESLRPTAVETAPPTSIPDSDPKQARRAYHTKNRASWKKSSLTLAQRDLITQRWIENEGSMGDFKCSELAKEMGFGGPGQVQGWVSYLSKIYSNNKTQKDREKGWEYIIDSGKISRIPAPGFFSKSDAIAFTGKPTAAVV